MLGECETLTDGDREKKRMEKVRKREFAASFFFERCVLNGNGFEKKRDFFGSLETDEIWWLFFIKKLWLFIENLR